MIKKIRLKGHETFILREGWLTKGLAAAEKDGTVFSKNSGADALGVGTNMAKAIRYWMQPIIKTEPPNLLFTNSIISKALFSIVRRLQGHNAFA